MKIYEKEKVILADALYSVMNELDFYKRNNDDSNFIVTLKFAFQDSQKLYLVQELMEGGDLRHYMAKSTITENKASEGY